jgi:DNA topoisomerase-1
MIYERPWRGGVGKDTEHVCPECGKPMRRVAISFVETLFFQPLHRGPFLGCSGYPHCKVTMHFNAEGKPVLDSQHTKHLCDKCGKPMRLRVNARAPFLFCTPCRNVKNVNAEDNPHNST